MTATAASILAQLAERVAAVADGRVPGPRCGGTLTAAEPELLMLLAAVDRLETNVGVMRDFSAALAEGRLDFAPPARLQLLGPLKALQASLRHLTWQTQEVAAGRLEHKVDFLGEFSDAFNRMIESLRDKRQAEAEALHASREAGVGNLASGLAHEINSPIQYMADNLRFLEQALSAPADDEAGDLRLPAQLAVDVRAAIAETLEGSLAIGTTVQAMREFSFAGERCTGRCDLNRAIGNTLIVSRHAWQEAARIDLCLDEQLPLVAGRTAEVCQVALQLVLNAAQALEDAGLHGRGRITITTLSVDDAVVLEVADNGPGIPPELREQVFGLFWTSRPDRGRRGLGLPTCRDIVTNRLGGSLDIGGEPGSGAVLTVRLRPALN